MDKKYIEKLKEGKATYEDLFNKVYDCIKSELSLQLCVDILDYAQFDQDCNDVELPVDDFYIEVIVNTGASEGIYMDCFTFDVSRRSSFGTLKTLEDDLDAYIKMGMIAGAFTCLAEQYWRFHS